MIVDRELRIYFSSGVRVGTIKCVTGYNHHGQRNAKINNDLCLTKCPRCNRCEDQEYVILCNRNENLKEEYIKELEQILKKSSRRESKCDIVKLIIADIKNYIFQENKEYVTT